MTDEIIKRKEELKRKILTLEWDKKLNQINYAKESKLKQFKEELKGIEDKLTAAN